MPCRRSLEDGASANTTEDQQWECNAALPEKRASWPLIVMSSRLHTLLVTLKSFPNRPHRTSQGIVIREVLRCT